jgi:orotate phosphoribosyltransferase
LDKDHFVGTSGRHFDTYINKDILYTYPVESAKVGKLFAEKYKDSNIEVVAAPALGGIIHFPMGSILFIKTEEKNCLQCVHRKNPRKTSDLHARL